MRTTPNLAKKAKLIRIKDDRNEVSNNMTSNEPSWIGRKLGGRYEIEEILGRGGMSTVYRATDPNLKRKVAIKLIHPHLTDNPEFIQRFEQEAAAIAQLRHNNIVQVHDFNNAQGIYYMVMEYIAGETLEDKLQKLNNAHMNMPIDETIKILAKVCDAANYAHERRMIHRDLKPSNVMINLVGEPILMDFGIAKIIGGRSHTATGAAMGTASYMSPEQVRGDKSDHRTDIYSLGIMLYEMLSGELPFQGDSTFQVMLKHVNEPIPDIRQFDMNTPLPLITILERALAKEPRERYQSAKEMGTALNAAGLQLHGSVSDTLASRYLDRLAILWKQANDYFSNGKYEICIDKLEEMKQIDPDFQQIRVDELHQNALDHLFARAAHLYQDGKYQESQDALTQLKARTSNDPEIEQLERNLQLAFSNQVVITKLETLYDEANTLLESQAYSHALSKWESLERQRGENPFPDLLEVEKRAKEGICSVKYQKAVTALSNNDPEKALQLWDEITAILPAYPDNQLVVYAAEQMLSSEQPSLNKSRFVGIVIGAVALFIIGFFIIRGIGGNEIERPTPTQSQILAADVEESATPTETISATKTAVSPTSTPQPDSVVVVAEKPSPTSAPPTNTPIPTATATSTPEVKTAVATNNASIFTAPDSGSETLAFVSFDETVTVLGRSSNPNWIYIKTEDDEEGFAAASRFDLSNIVTEELDIISASSTGTLNPTSVSGSSGPLSMVKYPLNGTGSCNDTGWTIQVYVEGSGGNGVYSYYWNDIVQVRDQAGGSAFLVSGIDNNTIGSVKVTSQDGQSISEDLFVPKPSCNN